MYIFAKNSPFIEPIGIHFHIGSQITELEPIKQAAQKIAQLAHSLLALKIDLKFFDVGGGVGIRYTDEQTITPYDYAQAVLESLRGLDLTIVCEPGRFLVGESGVLLTKVLYEKYNGQKRFVIIDAAMNDLMRPTLYHAIHQVRHYKSEQNTSLCDVVGPICESSDFLAKQVALPPMESGDLLVFENAGAYGYSMSSQYNTRPRAAEVAIHNGEVRLIKHRETFEDMVQDEQALLQTFMDSDKSNETNNR